MTTLPLFEGEGLAPRPRDGGPELTPEQREAVERRDGPLFVHAGAGSGKTRVLVERFVRAVLEDGVAPERMLAITFTEKAAAELRARIRERLLSMGEREHARAAESAWISTVHGFCSRLLRAHALTAGVDPDYRVLDEHLAERLAGQAFEAALEDFVAGEQEGRGRRLELVAAYGPDRLEQALRAVHATLRSRGEREPRLPRRPAPAPGRLAEARERLGRAVAAARSRLDDEDDPGRQVRAATEQLERCGVMLDSLPEGASPDPLELRELVVKRGNARTLRGAAFDVLEETHAACLALCADERATGDLRLLDELLEGFGRRYAGLKAARGALDFDDLELIVRDLLRARPALRERVRERFVHVLVDELQDTNRLQNELFDLVSDGNLFTVGDELQSIYRFRGAEVEVFAERREAAGPAGGAVSLLANFRSDPEILAVLGSAFAPVFGDAFAPLEPAQASFPWRPDPPPVELIAVDRDGGRWADALRRDPQAFGAAMRGLPPWRAAEARLLAARIHELIAAGEHAPGEVAVLVRSWTDVDRYARALAERGVATYVAGAGGYWNGREVGDLRAYLAALANPHDEEALVSVLGSPLVGASLDALALLGMGSRRGRGLWPVLEEAFADPEERSSDGAELAAALPAPDRDRIAGFVRSLREERGEVPRRSLAALVERAISASGYDRAVLALPGGERRLANLRKLKRLARQFEAAEGRDLRGFLDLISGREESASREGEAPLEGEALDAVRLMTVHAAKGLEFPVVCVADLGRGDPCASRLLRVAPDGRVGLRVPDPNGGSLETLDGPVLRGEEERAEEGEEQRLLWVAATRAERRLIVSGGLDLDKMRGAGSGAPMDWLAPALVPELAEEVRAGRHEGVSTRVAAGRRGRVQWQVVTASRLDDGLWAPARRPGGDAEARRTTGLAPASENREAPAEGSLPLAPPRALPLRMSYSALESYRRCGYRFYLERHLGIPATEAARSLDSARAERASGLDARTRGAVAHELLERIDLRRPTPPSTEQVAARLEAHGATPSPGDLDDLRRLFAGFVDSPLRARMARADGVRRELPFAFELGLGVESPGGSPEHSSPSLLVEGVLDVHGWEGEGALVIDYKSDHVAPGDDLEALCAESYSNQRLVYALAALRARAQWVEVAHLFLERPDEPVGVRFSAGEAPELERRLRALLGDMLAGRYEPSPTPHAGLCAGCPGRQALCSWPPERTSASAPGR